MNRLIMKMNSIFIWFLMLSIILTGCYSEIAYVEPDAPVVDHVWVPGYYVWSGASYVWVSGYYRYYHRGHYIIVRPRHYRR